MKTRCFLFIALFLLLPAASLTAEDAPLTSETAELSVPSDTPEAPLISETPDSTGTPPDSTASPQSLETPEASENRLFLGGYGELHLNAVFPDENPGSRPAPTLDFHRFVLFFGYQFTDRWSFLSEVELEHNWVQGGTAITADRTGYLVLEQAYLQYEIGPELALRVGVILLPVGLINEYHEPARFNTVERPLYHNRIIPTTWFATGIAAGGYLFSGALRYDLMVSEGLDDRRFSRTNGIRSGRQRGFYAELSNVMTTLRLDYVQLPGFVAGGSVSTNWNVSDRDEDNPHRYKRTTLSELHVAYNGRGFRSSLEFADIHYTPKDSEAEADVLRSQGFTGEIAYDVLRPLHRNETALYPYFRYSRINTAGSLKTRTAALDRIDVGLNFLPIRPLTIKANFARQLHPDERQNRSFVDIGVGYEF